MSQRNWKTSNRRQPRHHRPAAARLASPSEIENSPPPRGGGGAGSDPPLLPSPLPSLGGGSADDRTLTDVDSLLKEIVESAREEEKKEGIPNGGADLVSDDVGAIDNENAKAEGAGDGENADSEEADGGSADNEMGPKSDVGGGGKSGASDDDRSKESSGSKLLVPSANASRASGSVSSQLFSSSFPEPSSLGSGSAPGAARMLMGRAGSIGSGSLGRRSRGGSAPTYRRRASGPGPGPGGGAGGGGGGKVGTLPSAMAGDGGGPPAAPGQGLTELRRSSSEPPGMADVDPAADDDDGDDLAGGAKDRRGGRIGGGGDGQSVGAATEYRDADGPVIYAHDDDTVSQITSSLAGNTYATMGSSYFFGGAGGGSSGPLGSSFASKGTAGSGIGGGAGAPAKKRGGDGASFAESMDEIAVLLKRPDGAGPPAPRAAPNTSEAVAAICGGGTPSDKHLTSSMYSARYKKGGVADERRQRRNSYSTDSTSRRRNSFPMNDDEEDSDGDNEEGGGSEGFGSATDRGGSLPPVVHSAVDETLSVLRPFLAPIRPLTSALQRGVHAARRRLPKMDNRHKKDDDAVGFGTGIPEIDAIGSGDGAAGDKDYFSMLMSPNFVNRPPAHLRLTPRQKRARTIYAAIRVGGLLSILMCSFYVALGMVSTGEAAQPKDHAVDAAHFLGNAGGGGGDVDPLDMGDDAIGDRPGQGRRAKPRVRGGMAHAAHFLGNAGGEDVDPLDAGDDAIGDRPGQGRRAKPRVRGGMAHHKAGRERDSRVAQFEGGGDSLERLAADEAVKRDLAREGGVGLVTLPAVFDNLADVDDLDGLEEGGTDLPFFWHIPRTGGATMNDVLGGCLYLTLASDAGGTEGHGQEETLQVIKFPRHFSYVNVDTSNSAGIERARRLGLASSGLADVAVSSLLHEAMTLFSPKVRGRMFTLLRHPIDRAVSLFHYLQDTQWKEGPLSSLTMEEYFRGGMAENNWMTRFLTNQPTKGELDEDDLELAKEVLRRKCLVGLLDEKTESFSRFEWYFGWTLRTDKDRECHEKKVEWAWPLKHKHDDVEEGTDLWARILEHNVFDVQLYEYAKLLFEEQRRLFQ